MTDRLHLPQRYRRILEALLREHVPDAEVWAYGSRVTGESHDGSDLDLVVRGPELKPLGDGFFGLLDAIEKSNIPILVQAHDWARLPESFHREIERNYEVLQDVSEKSSAASWVQVQLGDVCRKIGSGATPRGGKEAYINDGPYALIRSQNVYNSGFSRDGLAFISEKQADALQNVDVFPKDVLLNITGDSVARVCQVDPEVLPARVNQHVAILRPDPNRLDPTFLRYYLVSPEIQTMLLSWAGSGGTRNALTKQMIESFEVQAPSDVAEQRAIAHILGRLDDKIELNRRMNETLEEMARALFQSWFVDFLPVRAKQRARTQTGDPVRAKAAATTPPQVGTDWSVERARAYLDSMDKSVVDLFPDRLVDSELGEIPEGWEVGKLGDIVTRLTNNENPGLSPNTEFSHFSIPAYDEGQLPKRELGKEIKSSKSRVPQNVVLLSKLNPEIERVWLADALPTEKAICSTEFLVLRARPPFTRSYVYCIARSPLFREQMKSLVTGTSKSHQRAPANAVLSIDTVLPSQEIAEAFELSASRVLRRVLDNRKESRTLATLRDALLPKLVSGEMQVNVPAHSDTKLAPNI